MLQRWRNQQRERTRHHQEGERMQRPRLRRQIGKPTLECAVEMKSKQDLRTKDEQPRFIERGLDTAILRAASHGAPRTQRVTPALASTQTSPLSWNRNIRVQRKTALRVPF